MSDQPNITTSGGVTLNATTINITGDVTGRDKLTSGVTAATPILRATPPAPPAHFTGRKADLDKFTRLLTSGQNVAITALHGLGGIGKTSLAQKLAEQLGLGDRQGRPYFPGGVLWWTLGPNPDVITALDVWARHVDAHIDLSSLPTPEMRAEAVRPLLAQLGKLCVIIDDVWDAPSFNVLRSAVPAGNPVLMTTRDADLAKTLRCRVERIDALSDDEAVDLLVNLLGPLDGNADAACDIAHLTGGLPLALELIAGLADSPDDLPTLAQRLKDKSPLDVLKRGTTREQSIETCFTLSYEHLDADLQRRFAALGVFALAPFDRNALAAVWAAQRADEEGDAVDQAISQLVRRSLLSRVIPNEVRNLNAADEAMEYTQHALLHDYALRVLKNPLPNPPPSNKSSSTGEEAATPSPVTPAVGGTGEGRGGGFLFHARHADYYRTFAKTQPWRATEHTFDQIEHGWQWVQTNAPEQTVNYQYAANNFLRTRGREFERIRWMQVALQASRDLKDRKQEGTLLNNLGYAHNALGQQDKALDYYEQALIIRREVGDRSGEGTTLHNLGAVYHALGQKDKALDYYAQALVIRREVGDRTGEGATLNNLGGVYDALGQKDKALSTFGQALVIHREVGNRTMEGTTLNNLGEVYRTLGQKDKALDYYEQALIIRREVGDRSGEGTTLHNLGLVYDALGQKDKALDYYAQALVIRREVGDRSGEGTTLNNLGLVYDALGQPDKALEYYEQALVIHREVGNRTLEGTTLGNLGAVYRTLGQMDKALDYMQQSITILREVGDRWSESVFLYHIGMLLDALGRTAEAVSYLEQNVALDETIGHPDLESDRRTLAWVRAKLAAASAS